MKTIDDLRKDVMDFNDIVFLIADINHALQDEHGDNTGLCRIAITPANGMVFVRFYYFCQYGKHGKKEECKNWSAKIDDCKSFDVAPLFGFIKTALLPKEGNHEND